MFADVIHWCPLTRDACIRKVLLALVKTAPRSLCFLAVIVSESWNECAI